MKVCASIKPRCEKCIRVKRTNAKGKVRTYIRCEIKRHNQRQG